MAPPLGLDLPLRGLHNGNGAKSGSSLGQSDSRVSNTERKALITYRNAGGVHEYFPLYGQVSSDVETVDRHTAFAAAAYCFIAMDFRATAVAEPALMVVEETEDGEEWIEDHDLGEFLDVPSPDFDMGELVYLTRLYRDMTGSALWLKVRNNGREVDRLVPFHGDQFRVEMDKEVGLIYGHFRVETARGMQTFKPADVVYFREANPTDWHRGLSRVDVALSLLNLSQHVRATAKALLTNAIFPSVIIQTDDEWNPDDEQWERFKAELNAYARTEKKGQPLALTGGGTATRVSFSLTDLLPTELLDRVEATVAAVFGIPAIVLQYLVGLKNSPWSNIKEARRMAYEDAIERLWQRDEKILTRQLLRETDQDATHFIRFDRSRVVALQADMTQDVLTAAAAAGFWSKNEQRVYTGKPKSDKPEHDEVPTAPDFSRLLGGARTEDDEEEEVTEEEDAKRIRARKQTKAQSELRRAIVQTVTDSIEAGTTLAAFAQLDKDRTEIVRIIERANVEPKVGDTPVETKDEVRKRIRRAQEEAESYLTTAARAQWDTMVRPHLQAGAQRAGLLIAADLTIDAGLLNEDLLEYAAREVGWLIRNVTLTTRDAVRAAVTEGLSAGEGSREIAQRLRDLPAFNRERAILVGRTESTRVANGAPREALSSFGKRTGTAFSKTWSAVLDDRVRDEHAEMDGETVGINEAFSNGLQSPGEPNCRCTLLYGVAEN